jgi:hypothetical protein
MNKKEVTNLYNSLRISQLNYDYIRYLPDAARFKNINENFFGIIEKTARHAHGEDFEKFLENPKIYQKLVRFTPEELNAVNSESFSVAISELLELTALKIKNG